MLIKIYHNPRCSKSRQALKLLQDNGVEPEIIEYLKFPPHKRELKNILGMLGVEPREIMRRKETIYISKKLDDDIHTKENLINAIVANPILLERPIVISESGAVIGRPPENVLKLF